MSRRRGLGINTLVQKLLDGTLMDTHHLNPRGQGGSNKKTNKKEVSVLEHRLWHLLVGDSTPEEAAKILSCWIINSSRFFAIPKGDSLYKTVQEINLWLASSNSDLKIKVICKQSKVIQFRAKRDIQFLPKIVS